MSNSAQLINQDSGDTERYTPEHIMSLVQEFFSEIDLDPASTKLANKTVKAKRIITKKGDGLTKPWLAETLWLNHPFAKGENPCKPNCKKKICNDPSASNYRGHHISVRIPSNLDWIRKLLKEYELGNFKESINISFVNSSEAWNQLLLLNGTQCFIAKRLEYHSPTGKKSGGVTKGSMLTYLGENPDRFKEFFSHIGAVK
jgi:hypothetical protein